MRNEKENDNIDDHDLIESAKSGDKESLEQLVKKYQDWIYNVALSFVGDGEAAADLTQEVLIKIITHLSLFRLESDFKTWVFRIVKNHFLNMKRSKYEKSTTSFEEFGNGLDSITDEDLSTFEHQAEREMLVEEAKISCMRGMLLCLDREQRLIYILAEIFEFTDTVGSEIMEITKGNFRVKLHRARNDLYNFMNAKCGLINKNNPCRCARKTKGFIEKGYVDPDNLQFQKNLIENVHRSAKERVDTLDDDLSTSYRLLFKDMPFLEAPKKIELVKKFTSTDSFKETFNFNDSGSLT